MEVQGEGYNWGLKNINASEEDDDDAMPPASFEHGRRCGSPGATEGLRSASICAKRLPAQPGPGDNQQDDLDDDPHASDSWILRVSEHA